MKIAYIYPALNTIGGADRVITEKANYFAENYGYEVFIITAHQNNVPIYFPLSPKVKHIDLGVNFLEQYKYSLIKRSFVYMKLLKQYKKKLTHTLKELNVDITITTISRDIDFLHKIKDGSIKIAEAHTAKPFIRNMHQLIEKGGIYRIIGKRWIKKMEKAIKHFDALVVLTDTDVKSWSNIKQAIAIPNSTPFYPEESSDCLSKKIISVGRLSDEKGYDRLIQAWEKVTSNHPDWRLTIYGQGMLLERLNNMIKEKAMEKTFTIEPPVKNIQEKYLESSIYVMSSHFEGFGMVLIEAMSCGVPCISFNCPYGPKNIIKEGEDGFLVTDGNIEEFSQKISYLIENEEKRISMGKKSKQNIQRYTSDHIMPQWKELFHSLLETQHIKH